MPGFKTFTSATLSSSDINSYLMQQAVIQCTSSTRPTPNEGMTIYETDTDRVLVYNGTGWVILAEPAVSWNTFTAASGVASAQFSAFFLDFGTAELPALIGGVTTTTVAARAINAAGTYATQTVCSATIPFTWTTSDAFHIAGSYQMASRTS